MVSDFKVGDVVKHNFKEFDSMYVITNWSSYPSMCHTIDLQYPHHPYKFMLDNLSHTEKDWPYIGNHPNIAKLIIEYKDQLIL